jgi:ribosomal protein S18 acetylase RimI-like enzyme
MRVATELIRGAEERDYEAVAKALARWWDSPGFDSDAARRERAALVPRLYLQHFADSSFVIERDGELLGFLIGFLSASRGDEGYIHFAGIDPALRRAGLGRALYERFFELCLAAGRNCVRAVTSPGNTRSIAFHRALGFSFEAGDFELEGLPVKRDYDGRELHRVCFVRVLGDGRPDCVALVSSAAGRGGSTRAADPRSAHVDRAPGGCLCGASAGGR